ncbi:hypothetical protein HG536_0H00220 [Torulaspora globosa]|uniref:RNB domain-containing protein n=1 Tax=Torulaspora globosa TaxID=48254 RepID=A0A7G3ZMB2_9SACH|nr:uncharacterized protein HG536_0H00220 [Torulaspora globosa]QLL34648.1 hypothetical protein HG536_0H00220 [Torulaspora globosa]
MVPGRWLARALHGSGARLRSAARRPAARYGTRDELEVPPLPSTSSVPDAQAISEQFLARTGDLEPGMEVKELPQIRREFGSRYEARYSKPSRAWLQRCWRGRDEHPEGSAAAARLTPGALMRRPLAVGDLVLLRAHAAELCMCVDVPVSTRDPRYTFATVDGSLRFGSRSAVLLRIPRELPAELSRPATLLVREAKHGFEPVGTIKNRADETLLLPVAARRLVTSGAAEQISQSAWAQLPIALKKLELLHRRLQDAAGPQALPFFNLVLMVQSLELSRAVGSADGDRYVERVIAESVATSRSEMDASCLLACYWGLEAQQKSHLWGDITMSRALLSPVAVTVLPFESQHLFYARLKEELKADGHVKINEFARLANGGRYRELADSFPQIIQLFKDYAAGNLQSNETAVSLIANIFRKIREFAEGDITRDRCEQLLSRTLVEDVVENPIHCNFALALPGSSPRSQVNETVYELAKPVEQKEAAVERFDFGDLPVYCIDAEDAHEIDDGVSIEDAGKGRFTLHVHIADPTALFPESGLNEESGIRDEILKMAFERAFTTYLPDIVVPMLPRAYCEAGDLGKQGRKTKCVTFSVDVKVSGERIEVLYETYKIRLGLISNFPKVTYEVVDQYLEDAGKGKAVTPLVRDLQKMHRISGLLRKSRIFNDDAVVFGSGFNQGLVALSPVDREISFFDQKETASTLLVSELMILANTLAGRYFAENNIPGVFRCYQTLSMRDQAEREYENMKRKVKKGILPTTKDINMLSSLLNSSFYSEYPAAHSMIGAKQYLTVTSPLRRFPDIINHLQIQKVLRGLPLCFTQKEVSRLLWHIQYRDAVLKSAASHQASYWTLKYIKKLIQDSPDMKFSVNITSVSQFNMVQCALSDFPSARGTLKLKPGATTVPAIGDTVKNCKVGKIDCLDGLLELEL